MNIGEIKERAESQKGGLVTMTKSEYDYLLDLFDTANFELLMVAKLSAGLFEQRFNEAHAEVIRDNVIRKSSE